ncbi:MAG: DNA cytosine methyltransferase [Candidatus Electrothrix sp. GM3_4]|nr:DNA cytosine methyltransferase [Candidatus Electrothrix sp. GM3_4]
MKKKIIAIDLFCGAGGLTRGLELAGIDVKAGYDIDKKCEFPYSENNSSKFYHADIKDITAKDITANWDTNSFKLLAGCAPCQPFSNYMTGKKNTRTSDKWAMLYEFERIAKETLPDFLTMENVPALVQKDIFTSFVNTLVELGYYVDYKIINCADYGVPQNRKRLVLLASRHSPMTVPQKTCHTPKTVAEAIGVLPPIRHGEMCESDRLHTASKLADINLKRIKQSKQGGTWQDWDSELITSCHTKKTGERYKSVYGRMSWDAPAPTMTTQCYGYGNGRFGHPEQDRAISLREAAIFQSFPEAYQFVQKGEKITFKVVGRLIGNAVPVTLGKIIGNTIIQAASS